MIQKRNTNEFTGTVTSAFTKTLESLLTSGYLKATSGVFRAQGYRLESRTRGALKLGLWRKTLNRLSSNSQPRRLVVIPGFIDAALSWMPLFAPLNPFLKAQYDEVIIIEFPSFLGILLREPGFTSMDQMITFMNETLESLKPKAVLGHSLGAWLAGSYAIQVQNPFLEKLVLMNPAGYFANDSERAHWAMPFEKAVKEGFHAVKPYLYPKHPKILARLLRVFESKMEKMVHSPELKLFIESVREEHFMDNRLSEIKAQTWLVWGENDSLIRLNNLPAWLEKLTHPEAQADSVVLKNTGHILHFESPVKTFKSLYRVLLAPSSTRNTK